MSTRFPADPVDTANHFHAETILFSRSRAGKASRMDAVAVALLMLLMAALGCVVLLASTPTAKADPDAGVYAYAATYGGAVCEVLDEYPSFAGMYGIASAINEQDGLSFHQAGQVIAISVMEICPRHLSLVKRFAESAGGYA